MKAILSFTTGDATVASRSGHPVEHRKSKQMLHMRRLDVTTEGNWVARNCPPLKLAEFQAIYKKPADI